jgi:ABC-type phosphate/phosphonate transport system substrate-binding protein
LKHALSLVTLATLAAAGPLLAAPPAGNQKTSFAPALGAAPAGRDAPAAAAGGSDTTLVFSAPPRETAEDGERMYQPLARYLAQATGRPVVYKHPGNWFSYQTEMQKGGYDLVFDGPHLNSWRINNLQHDTVVRFADEHVFAVVVRKDNATLNEVKQLAGQRVCGMNPPNLGTLAVLSQFDNPLRQPLIVDTLGWAKAYEGMAADKKCAAAILPVAVLRKLDGGGNFTRVIHKTRSLPNQTLSAGPRVTRDDQAKIAAALTAPEAMAVTAVLREAYGADKGFAPARKEDYAGLDSFLKDSWGYAR